MKGATVESAWSNCAARERKRHESSEYGRSAQRHVDEAPCAGCADLARICSAPIRLEILRLLTAGSANVTALALALDLDVAHVSHHLAPLREADLVAVRNEGKRHIYSLGPRATVCSDTRRPFLRLEADDGGAVICLHLADASGSVRDDSAS